ncbi:uncharacterized protein ACOB8E_006801 isoform 1-T1 [Sarcophilus harrisii]
MNYVPEFLVIRKVRDCWTDIETQGKAAYLMSMNSGIRIYYGFKKELTLAMETELRRGADPGMSPEHTDQRRVYYGFKKELTLAIETELRGGADPGISPEHTNQKSLRLSSEPNFSPRLRRSPPWPRNQPFLARLQIFFGRCRCCCHPYLGQ